MADVTLLLALFSWSTHAATDTLEVRFLGNASFAISDGVHTILTDFPYRSGAFGYMTYQADALQQPDDAVSLITHHHADHFDIGLVRRHGWRVIGPRDVADTVGDQAMGSEGVTNVGAFRIEAVRTPHVDFHHSYVISWRGRRLFLPGDTEEIDALIAAGPLDIAFVTPWLWCTLAASGQVLDAARVVVHHNTTGETDRGCGNLTVLQQGESIRLPAR